MIRNGSTNHCKHFQLHYILYLFSLFVECVYCRDLWSDALPEGPEVVLEKGKPIQLPENFNKVQLCKLQGTLYSDSLSKLDRITELRICQHQLRNIEKGALCASSSIKILDIDFFGNANPPNLTKETFENCQNLEELFIKYDITTPPFSSLEANAFDNLINLKKIAIHGYRFNHLKKNFLKIPKTSLEELVLSFNYIDQIDADVFDFPKLKILYIVHNSKLMHLPKILFTNLRKLEKLVLRDNALIDLTWDEFEGLISLKELDLSDNQISSLDAEKIAKNLPNLQNFQFDINPLSCEERKVFVEKIREKLKREVEVSMNGFFNSCGQE